jgi:hypothetical protein
MFFKNKDIVWTVSAMVPGEVAISLNAEFAKKVRECPVERNSFENTVWFKTGSRKKKPAQFIDFKEGILPSCFHCNTGGGVWLSLNEVSSSDEYALTYFTHNADHTADQLWLLNAFRAWAEAAKFALR